MEAIFELLEDLESNLKSLPQDTHWFCPKRDDDDVVDYDNPDEPEEEVTIGEKQDLLTAAKERFDKAYMFCLVFGLSEEGLETHAWFLQRFNDALTSCDKCVRNYHMGRRDFLQKLLEDYSEEQVEGISKRLDQIDLERIRIGLDRARKLLEELPVEQRTQAKLASDPPSLLALYEAICCPAWLRKEGIESHINFDFVFGAIQRKKVLKLGDVLPAMTFWLFSSNTVRRTFALTSWQRHTKTLDKATFEYAVRDLLMQAIPHIAVSQSQTDAQRIWECLLLVIKRMDEDLITHSLAAMDCVPSVYHLAINHLPKADGDILCLILEALCILVTKAPKTFWAAYGTISPPTVADLIFGSPDYTTLLSQIPMDIKGDEVEHTVPTMWIRPFLVSLGAAQQFELCRTLLHHFLRRLPNDPKANGSLRFICNRAGLDAFVVTLTTFLAQDYNINSASSMIIVNNVLGLVADYRDTISQCAELANAHRDDPTGYAKELSRLALLVWRNSVSLIAKMLNAQYKALSAGTPFNFESPTYFKPLWESILSSTGSGSLVLAENVIDGMGSFPGLDKVRRSKSAAKPTKEEDQYNEDVGIVFDNIALFLERLSDFSTKDLDHLCTERTVSMALLSYLAPPTQPIYEAAVELVKVATGEDTRKGAISTLIDKHFLNTLNAFYQSSVVISKAGSFASWPYLLKTNREVTSALCDTQTGILRMRTITDSYEVAAISRWWTYQWRALSLAFDRTENWSLSNPQEIMMNFCRDVMDYAQFLFDQYGILGSVLDNRPDKDGDASTRNANGTGRKSLLEQPKHTLFHMAKWVRLRDEYLASTIVSLVCKLLRRLGEFDMEIDEKTKAYLDRAINGTTRTKLTRQQIAELKKAMDEHFGIEEIIPVPIIPKKQSTIDLWSKSGGDVKQEGSIKNELSVKSEPRGISDYLAKESQSLTKTASGKNTTLELMRARQQVAMIEKKKQQSALSIKEIRQREKEEKRARDALQAAKARALRTGTAGEGSGLKGIGIQGKDHAPRSEIMVDSDDETSESDDDDDDGTSLIARVKQTSKQVSEYEESKRRAFLQQQAKGPVVKKKIMRSLKDMRARLVPNMDGLHTTILSWDIFHEGDMPPNIEVNLQVGDTYRSIQDYVSTYNPLLIMEAWRSFVTARDESSAKSFAIKVANRMSVDRYVEVSTSMEIAENKDVSVGEGDIMLLSKGSDPLNDKHAPHCLARVFRITRKKDIMEVSYRISSNNNTLVSTLAPSTQIRGVKITSMITIEREYAALLSLQYYDLMQEVLDAKPSPILNYSEAKLDRFINLYRVNKGQAKAILSASENDGFTLIQGPPGSGKTKTIVAMVGSLLTSTLQAAKAAVGSVAINKPRLGPGVGAPDSKPSQKKLLVCAPSNAAVDELVMRLKQGVKDEQGQFHKINVIRLGRSDAINAAVRDVTLDELVATRMEANARGKDSVQSVRDKLHQEAGRLKEELATLRPQLEEARSKNDTSLVSKLQREFDTKKREQLQIGSKIDEDKESGNSAHRENEINRRRLQQEIINGAHVLCSTLSGSAHDMFKNLEVEFETVIIDEAAQCIELSALIPLKYGCTKAILVGDPKQLPPTVLSQVAAKYGYEQSLFVRMQRQYPKDVHLLDTQYRMHPEISRFPSQTFYEGRLLDGEGMAALRQQPWHECSILGPYRFFDVKGTQATGQYGHSFTNVEEVKFAMQLYTRITTDYRSCNLKGKVGIITPYKAQLRELRNQFARRFGENILDEVDFNTTDAFQGRESDIIIFSCVRARAKGGIGFLDDIRRMNVGLTRAKSSMWVLGDANALIQGEYWAKLVGDAKARNLYTGGDVISMLRRPLPKDGLKSQNPVPIPEAVKSPSSAASDNAMEWDATDKTGERNAPQGSKSSPSVGTCSKCGDKHATSSCTISVVTHQQKRPRATPSPESSEQPPPKKRPGSLDPRDSPRTSSVPATKAKEPSKIDKANGAPVKSSSNTKAAAALAPPDLLLMKPGGDTARNATIVDVNEAGPSKADGTKPTRPAPPLNRPPMVRKKAPADPFIRKKPARR